MRLIMLECAKCRHVAKNSIDGMENCFYYDAFGKLIVRAIAGHAEFKFYDGGAETLRFDGGP